MQSLKGPLYDNCQILAPDGTLMCRCNRKRTDWYTNRGLAEIVCNDPHTIRLLFQPKGLGKAGQPYYLQVLDNMCVVCGLQDDLTKHHCVPICYRQYFPEEKRSRQHYDVLPVCVECHHKYEPFAYALKREIQTNLGIQPESPSTLPFKIKGYAVALQKFGNKIPVERVQILRAKISEYLKREVSAEDIEKLASESLSKNLRKMEVSPSQLVVERLTDLDAFIIKWRKHFVETMQPKYLPPYWEIPYQENI